MSFVFSTDFDRMVDEALDERANAAQEKALTADDIADKIKQSLIGQDRVVDQVSWFVSSRMNRRVPRKTPLANILLAGPTGTGKTELAKQLAEAVFEDPARLCVIPCNQIGTSETALSGLIGAPQVYRGSGRGQIPEFVSQFGGGILLFDEIEKAVPTKDAPLAKMLLNIMDEGTAQCLFDNSKVDLRPSIIILTSNVKQRELAEMVAGTPDPDQQENAAKAILQDAFAPEFLERLDLVTSTDPLDTKSKIRIVALNIEKLAKAHDLDLVGFDASAVELMIEAAERWSKNTNGGARSIIRWIERKLDDALWSARNEKGLRRARIDMKDDVPVVYSADGGPDVA